MEKPLKILVVDDDGCMRLVLEEFLKLKGHSVSLAADGVRAQEVLSLEGGKFDIVITDYQMPRLLGVELVRWIKGAYPRVKIIFMTGNVEDNVMSMARAAGADEVFRKPFEFTALSLTIKKMSAIGSAN